MFMFYFHTRFHILSASGSNQQLSRRFSAGSMVFLYILQNDYLQQTSMFFRLITTHCFQDCKFCGTSVASVSDFCILTTLVQIIGNWEVQHWGGLLCHNVYTKFHKVWMTCLETEVGQRAPFGGGAHHAFYEPWAGSITHLHVESFRIVLLLHIGAVDINDFVS
jgi:hypothetical protein